MPEISECRTVTLMQVSQMLRTYIDTHQHHSAVEERWFASKLGDVVPVCEEVRTGGMSRETRAEVDRFRLKEIEKEKDRERRAIAELDREATRIEGRLRPPEAAA